MTRPAGSWISAATAALWLAVAGAPASALAADPLEYKVKAAFLFNFARFVTWPADRLPSPDSPLTLCTLAGDPLGPALEETVRGKEVSSRPLQAVSVQRGQDLSHCHIAYVGGAQPDDLLQAAAGHHVLTVHESTGTRPAGVIRFFIQDRHVRFEINAAAAERERLQLSSKLLSVARVVSQ